MKTLSQLFQNYRQAAWRTQIQWIGLFLAMLVAVAIVLGFYVNITTRTALAGREIAYAQDDLITMQHKISDLESQIASLTSTQNIQERAVAMGFIPATADEFMYVVVPGYSPKTAINLAPKLVRDLKPIILPEYTESLFDWFANRGRP
jgi:hypothetical protein